MSDIQKMIGKDEAAEFLRLVREQLGDLQPDWDEIKPILYDTFKEFDTLPPVNVSVALYSLPETEQQKVCEQIAAFAANYGRQCATSMLVPLAVARVQLWASRKYGTTGE